MEFVEGVRLDRHVRDFGLAKITETETEEQLSRMREICMSGSTRGRAVASRQPPLYATR